MGRKGGIMIGTWQALVIDCEDPDALARFYEQLLGMIRIDNEPDWVSIGDAADRPAIAFQAVSPYVAPEWPGHVHPQQMHVDVRVKDLDLGEEETFELVGPGDEDYDNNKILTTSPIGQGLLGKKRGEVAEIQVPMGKLRFEILDISLP